MRAMVAVLVHGVPETPRVWDGLRQHLSRTDTVAVSLPGFGTTVPDGFGSSMNEYAAWLTTELERIVKDSGGPVDLVGHDWGAGFTLRVVSTRSDLVRTWVLDAAGLADPEFEWHDFAKIWQTPGAGEDFFATQMAASPEDRASVFEMFGVPAEERHRLIAVDPTMADCILALYRSATDVGREWAPDFKDVPAPGAVVIPADDPFLAEDRATSAAARAGARTILLPSVGHWWMLQDPAAGAAMLEQFWSSLG